MSPHDPTAFESPIDERDGGRGGAGCREVNAMVDQDRNQRTHELAGYPSRHLLVQFHIGKLGRAIDGHQHVKALLLAHTIRQGALAITICDGC